MLSVELKWHTNEQVRDQGGQIVKTADKSSNLISDYKPAPLFNQSIQSFSRT